MILERQLAFSPLLFITVSVFCSPRPLDPWAPASNAGSQISWQLQFTFQKFWSNCSLCATSFFPRFHVLLMLHPMWTWQTSTGNNSCGWTITGLSCMWWHQERQLCREEHDPVVASLDLHTNHPGSSLRWPLMGFFFSDLTAQNNWKWPSWYLRPFFFFYLSGMICRLRLVCRISTPTRLPRGK